MKLTHYDAGGRIRMVDVSAKAETERQAVAGALVKMSARTLTAVRSSSEQTIVAATRDLIKNLLPQ